MRRCVSENEMSMQVVEKSNAGLSRTLAITVSAQELTDKLDAKIAEVTPRVSLKGFRPGKVPAAHVRKLYGREMMGEIIQETLNETSQRALDEANIRPAAPAEMKLSSDIEQVVAGRADLAYEVEVEIMPDFEPIDPTTIELKRPVYEATEADIDEGMEGLLKQLRTYETKTGEAPEAVKGDMVVVDFTGRIDGELFEGGAATDAEVVLGADRFIPGFEAQLEGAKAGEDRVLKVIFPADYGAPNLAGKAAEFEVKIKDVKAPLDAEADAAFAERVGFDSLEALRNALKVQLDQEFGNTARFRLKRRLLDVLDEKHAFPLPEKMVENEFQQIWQQVEADRAQGGLAPEDAEKSEDDLRTEYRKIAERRVRLGLVLAEIGRRAGVNVTDQELSAAIMAEARRYPGQEKEVFDFYRANPGAAAQKRAPIYEEKVCDYIFGVAKIEDEPMSKEELMADEDLPE
jgi:trigger factor